MPIVLCVHRIVECQKPILHHDAQRYSGIDKVISVGETFQLPAPDFRVTEGSTIAVLLGPRDFSQMDREDRIRACYHHSCLLYVSGKRMTNATLRQRLGIKPKNSRKRSIIPVR